MGATAAMLTHAQQAEQRSPNASKRSAKIGRGRAIKGPDTIQVLLQHSCHTPIRAAEANAMRNPALAPPFVQMMRQMFHSLEVGADANGPMREVARCLREHASSGPASSEA